jgi:3-isopropylmalate/(R)-2-methylmalate dehydratase small subunit
VDLAAQTVALPDGRCLSFAIDGVRKEQMLNGLDDIGITLQYASRIEAFESDYRTRRPWLFREQADLLSNRNKTQDAPS